MDETARSIVDSITHHYTEAREVLPGVKCKVFFDCARLSPSDLARLAAEATGDLNHDDFDLVVGMAYTGILFAGAVAGGKPVSILQHDNNIFGPSVNSKRVILVDDVVASGGRMLRAEKVLENNGAKVVGFACIVDRTSSPAAISPLYSAVQSPME